MSSFSIPQSQEHLNNNGYKRNHGVTGSKCKRYLFKFARILFARPKGEYNRGSTTDATLHNAECFCQHNLLSYTPCLCVTNIKCQTWYKKSNRLFNETGMNLIWIWTVKTGRKWELLLLLPLLLSRFLGWLKVHMVAIRLRPQGHSSKFWCVQWKARRQIWHQVPHGNGSINLCWRVYPPRCHGSSVAGNIWVAIPKCDARKVRLRIETGEHLENRDVFNQNPEFF